MSTEGQRKCCHCGTWFRLRGRNAWHQRFCLEPACRVASKRRSQQKWCRKNPGHFRGEMYVKKTQAWRRKHPGYWRAKRTAAPGGPPDALQEILAAQGFGHEQVRVFRNCLSDEISRPLQDLLLAQQHALVGLASMITGEPLQEDIAQVLTACYQRGQRIGGSVPWMQPQEVNHERPRTDYAAATATHSPAV